MPDWLPDPLLLVLGGVVLLWSAERVVEHAEHLARALRVPNAVVGAVVLGFGTSLPELQVCLDAALTGKPAIATGNVVGSNIANVGLVLGTAAFVSPFVAERSVLRLTLPLGLLAAIGITAWLVMGGTLGAATGGALLLVFAVYMAASLQMARKHRAENVEAPEGTQSAHGRDITWILVSLVGIAIGAHWFTAGAEGVAHLLGVPQEVVALSLVALGTSLPEVVTTLAAARQGHAQLAVGNVAGSNLFNLLFVLGSTAVVRELPVSDAMRTFDFPAMCVFALLAFPLFSRARRIGKRHGTLLIGLYVAYVIWTYAQGRTPAA